MTTPTPVCRALSVTMINADGSTDLFTPALHLEQMTTDRDYWQELAGQRREQVRTLEADLVMCREQLAQETERAESYRLDVAAIRGALDAPDDADVNQLIDVVHAITELAEKAEYVAQQLPTPDA